MSWKTRNVYKSSLFFFAEAIKQRGFFLLRPSTEFGGSKINYRDLNSEGVFKETLYVALVVIFLKFFFTYWFISQSSQIKKIINMLIAIF